MSVDKPYFEIANFEFDQAALLDATNIMAEKYASRRHDYQAPGNWNLKFPFYEHPAFVVLFKHFAPLCLPIFRILHYPPSFKGRIHTDGVSKDTMKACINIPIMGCCEPNYSYWYEVDNNLREATEINSRTGVHTTWFVYKTEPTPSDQYLLKDKAAVYDVKKPHKASNVLADQERRILSVMLKPEVSFVDAVRHVST